MDDVHGKEIPLMHTTVKIPGQKPRGSRTQGASSSASSHQVNELASDLSNLSIAGGNNHILNISAMLIDVYIKISF